MRPWLRRLMTRSVALLPAVIVIALSGDHGTYKLLILSQVVLSLQLPFATIPLIHFTSDRNKMGVFANPLWVKIAAWLVAAVILGLNLALAYGVLRGWLGVSPVWVWLIMIPILLVVLAALAYITLRPLFRAGRVWDSGVRKASAAVAEAIRPVAVRHIGVALDHSVGDAVILSAALSQARVHKAMMTLLHVVDTPGTMVFGGESGSLHGSEDQAYLEELAREVEALDLPVETMLRFGNPADEIIRSVEEAGHCHRIGGVAAR